MNAALRRESSRTANPPEVQVILRRWELAYRVFVGGCLLLCALVSLAILATWIL